MNLENKNNKKYTDCPNCESNNTKIISYTSFNIPLAICYGAAGAGLTIVLLMLAMNAYIHIESGWIHDGMLDFIFVIFVFPICGFIYGGNKEKYINIICKDCGYKFRKLSKN